jgi:cell division protein FtsB
MHLPLDHEHGRWRIWIFLTILVMLLFCLAYAFGYRRGLRAQRARQAATLDDAYASLDRLRDRNDRHDEETQQLRVLLLEETQRYRLQLLETRHERDLLLGERRAANVMAIMMESQLRQLTFMTGRIDRLRSLIINHQPPCPLGDSILVQENLDGAEWHLDPECPVLTLNRTPIAELPHCEMCAARDLRMVQDRAFTGR